MADILTPPPILNAIAEQPGLLTPRPWSRYFQAVRDQVMALMTWQSTLLATTPPPDVGPVSVTGTAETAARGDHTHGAGASGGYSDEQAQDAVGTILTEGPTVEWIYDDALPGILAQVKTQRSILYDANGLMLSGDVVTPGATQLYGTDGAGTRGWYAQPTPPAPGPTDEHIQDLMFTTMNDSPHINWTYNDTLNYLQCDLFAQCINTADLTNDGVTYAKIQNVTDNRLLGRSAGSAGDVQELTTGAGLTLSGGVLSATTLYEAGTFTVTATGFSGTAPTATVRYVRVGGQITLKFNQVTGTSNATTFTLTGAPAAVLPTVAGSVFCLVRAVDNGGGLIGTFLLSSSGTWTLSTQAGPWTASGTKGLEVCAVTYLL